MRFCCGDWVLETEARQIIRAGQPVRVSPKAFDLLTALLADQPHVLSKVDLQQRIWPDTYVTETSLATLVAELRSALGDEARQPRYIRTVHRHGYAFCGAATRESEDSWPPASGERRVLVVLRGREIALAAGAHILGREPGVAVWLDSVRVSRHHARLVVSATGASIEDLGSKNGTFVNRVRICGVQPLSDRDEVGLGPERLVVHLLGDPAATQTEPP